MRYILISCRVVALIISISAVYVVLRSFLLSFFNNFIFGFIKKNMTERKEEIKNKYSLIKVKNKKFIHNF
jgi:hypothetical protein